MGELGDFGCLFCMICFNSMELLLVIFFFGDFVVVFSIFEGDVDIVIFDVENWCLICNFIKGYNMDFCYF